MRRWFRCLLRTMIMVVSLFGVWWGWGVHNARERKKILASEHITWTGVEDPTPVGLTPLGRKTGRLPLAWQLGGARSVHTLRIWVGFPSAERRVVELFP